MKLSLPGKLRGFLAARMSPKELYGLHLTIGVALLIAAAIAFDHVAGAVVDGAPMTLLDVELARWLHEHARANDGPRMFMLAVTHLHSTPGVLGLALVLGYWWYRRGHRYWLLALLVTVPGGMLLNVLLKHIFERARPEFTNPILNLDTYSFPSGHTLAATVLYGLLACYLARRSRSWGGRVLPFAGAAAMVALVALSRMYLGAHYLTDVVAAVAEGCAWLAVCITATTTLNRRRVRRAQARPGGARPADMRASEPEES